MRSKDWKEVLDYSDVGIKNFAMDEIVLHFNKTFGFTSAAANWGTDQVSVNYIPYNSCQPYLSLSVSPLIQHPLKWLLLPSIRQ